ncbi:MAG: hypothetical protein J6Z23_01815 [Lachnospiraceae bacterium]|nr:hypothetical protein [Lachnospiraceae bacterium]
MKKFLALLMAALMVLALASCGGDNKTTEAGTTEAPASTKTFQFAGKYEEAGEYASMLNNAFLLTLNEDMTAVCDKYAFSMYDTSDAASNRTYTQSYLSGTWKEVEKDGVPCLQIKLAYYDANGNASNATTSYAYDVAGEYSFDMTYPVTPGQSYTRTVTMTGKEGTLYADDNAFIQANKAEFTAPESVAQFVDSEKNVTAYLQEDGTVLVYSGYDKFAEGKWSNGENGLSITIGGNAVELTKDGNAASFGLVRTMGDFTNNYTLKCNDISVLGTPEVAEDAPYTCAMNMGGNETKAELTLNEDGTGNLKVFMDMAVKYTKVGSAVVLESAGELAGYAASIWQNIGHAFLLNEDKSMVALKGAYSTDTGLAFYLTDDTAMTAELPSYHFAKTGFTYKLEENTLTVTAPSADDLGAFAQVWTGMGGAKWTVNGTTATKAE